MANLEKRYIGFIWLFLLIAALFISSCAPSTRIARKDATNAELIEILSKPDPDPGYWNHRRAADLLGRRDAKDAIPVLIKNLDSPDEEVIRECTIALGKIGDRSAVPVLIDYLNGRFLQAKDRNVMGDCLIALGRIGIKDPAVRDRIRPHLERYVRSGTEDQVRWAKRALGYWGE